MSESIEGLTPREIVRELDKYIVGQGQAKRAVAVALRNRFRRRRLPEELRDEVIPKNILMIGPTGVGKTEIARRLAALANAPFIKVEASKFTEVGYVGRDVDSMVRDLAQVAYRLVEAERIEMVQDQARERAIDRIVNILEPLPQREHSPSDFISSLSEAMQSGFQSRSEARQEEDDRLRAQVQRKERLRERLRQEIAAGERDQQPIDIEVEDQTPVTVQGFGANGMDEVISNLTDALGSAFRKKRTRSVMVAEARRILAEEEARKLIDQEDVRRDAVHRAEDTGIIFIDEIDKIAGREGTHGPEVSREGVQRDILPIIEGSTVVTRYGPVRTDHVLFVAAGAFHISKPSDLIPELQGRLPLRVELDALTEADFRRILTEPKNALLRQYEALMATEGIHLKFDDDAIDELSRMAFRVNESAENIGARRLHTIMEKLLEELSFEAPDLEVHDFVITRQYVQDRLGSLVQDQDRSRFIL
ncbi:MAG TPA: ATP-dependent protease ATPase subunit HslU [Armatimonadota bacterium]|nr:ATP-dependent protease ATPase subunit HslU [Armatimonadota bacterium]